MEIIELFKKLLFFRSITPDDGGAFEFLEGYFEGWESMRFDKNGVKNLFLYKKFGDVEHLCFAGHIDVVPPGDGWQSDPFLPVEKDGFIYARGAQDMKSGLAAFLLAAKNAQKFSGTLSLLLTSDEEGDAHFGTLYALEELKKIDFLPDFAVVAEPTCENVFGDAIKVGRRGSINGVIEIFGVQGHAAYPEKSKNPIHEASGALAQIAGVDLDGGDEFFAPSKIVVTDIRGGMEVTNVTPGKLKIMFNVRNSTKTDAKKIEDFINEKFAGLDFRLTLKPSAKPFVTDKNSKVVQNLVVSIEKITREKSKFSTAGGTSDARFFGEFGIATVEFGPKNDTIHAPNERVGVDEVEKLYRIFSDFIENF